MRNPNIFTRPRLVPATLLLAAGAIACQSGDSNVPEPTDNTADTLTVECNVTAEPTATPAHSAEIALEGTNMEVAGEWRPMTALYTFGDGAIEEHGLATIHTYPRPGTYTVRADITMDVAPGVNAPFKNGSVSCIAASVTVP